MNHHLCITLLAADVLAVAVTSVASVAPSLPIVHSPKEPRLTLGLSGPDDDLTIGTLTSDGNVVFPTRIQAG